MKDPAQDDNIREQATSLGARARQKLVTVRQRMPEVEGRTRRMAHWGEVNGFAPKIRDAMREARP